MKEETYSEYHVRGFAERCLREEADAILDLIPQLDEHFDKAVEMMYHCRGKVIVTGVGKSGNIGAKIAATLASTGTPAFYVNPLDVYHGDLGVITKDDIVLALSNSGQTDELLRFIPIVLHMNVPIISMTGNSNYLLANYSDVMRSNDLPIIPQEMHLGEAIIHVSKGKLGLGVSLEDGKVIGLITDGDIRRAMEKWQAQFFDKTVSDIMTRHPKMVLPDTKITEIQNIMHQNKVHTVLVVDENLHLLGVVDHYSCMI